MPVGARVHLSERIDLMAEVTVIGFVVPALDPRNARANAARGEGDEVGNVAIVGACAARAAESKGDGVGGVPQLEPRATGAVEGKCGVEGDGALRKCARTDYKLMSPSRGVVTIN
jgi:hypothetical protein